MMTTSLFVLLVLGYSGFGITCEPADDMFDVLPMDKTVQRGTNVTFNCMLKDSGIEVWQYKLLNRTNLLIVSSLLNNESAILGFMLSLDGSLTIPDVQPHHAGIYFCGRAGDGLCSNATLKVQDVRLVGGPNEFEGRVEVYVRSLRVWARWCHPGGNINITTIRVVCRQLGHGDMSEGGISLDGFYGIRNESPGISNVSCQGTENKITECMHTSHTTAPDNCNDVGLYCRDPTCDNDGKVKLTDNTTSTEGRVEICESGYRAGLCYENFTRKAARVLCRQLGFSTNNANGSETGAIPYFRGISTSNCTGDEIGFDQCQSMSAVFRLCSRVRLNCPELSRHGDSTEEDTNTSSGGNTDIATTSTTATAVSTSTGTAANTADNVADNTPAPPNVVAIVLGVVCGVPVLLLLCGGIFLVRNKCNQVSPDKTKMLVIREKTTTIDESSDSEHEEFVTNDIEMIVLTEKNPL